MDMEKYIVVRVRKVKDEKLNTNVLAKRSIIKDLSIADEQNKKCKLIFKNINTGEITEEDEMLIDYIYPIDENPEELRAIFRQNNHYREAVIMIGIEFEEQKITDIDKNGGSEMKKINFGIDCGKITDGSLTLSFYGIAFKNQDNGSYTAYNSKTNELIDVSEFIFDMDMFLKMPIGIKEIKQNDIILHNNEYVIIQTISEDCKTIVGINPVKGEKKTIVPKKNMFGFDYLIKVVNLGENMFPSEQQANENKPFGNINPLMLYSMFSENNTNDKKSLIEMMMLSNFMQNK